MTDAQYAFALVGQNLSGPAWQEFINQAKAADKAVGAIKDPLGKVGTVLDNLALKRPFDEIDKSLKTVTGTIGFVKSGLQAMAGLWVVDKVLNYADGIQATAVQVSALAERTGFTTEQVQALQRASRLGGEEFDKLADYARSNSGWLDRVTESARRAGTVIGTDTVQGLNDTAKASDRARREADDFRANLDRLAGPTVLWGVQQLSGGFKSMADSLDLIKVNAGAALPTIREIANILTGGQASRLFGDTADERAAADLRNLEERVVRARQNAERFSAQSSVGGRWQRTRNNLGESALAELTEAEDALAQAQAREIQRRLRNNTRAKEREQGFFTLPIDAEIAEWSRYGDRFNRGGAGGEKRDRIGENLELYKTQARAAQTALNELFKVARQPLPLDDLERQIKLEKEIADAEAAASKYARNDPRIPQLREQITLRETAESGYQKLINALKLADATERQYGDGQRQFLQTESQLAEARDTGRLSLQAYTVAMIDLGRVTEDARLRNIGLMGGIDAFFAGWANAQNQFTRANNEFALGGKVFDSVMSNMDQALNALVTNSEVNLNRLLGSFFLTIAQMEMRAAASQLWGAAGGMSGILGFLGLGGGSNAGGFADAAIGSGAGITNGVPNFFGMASGGDIEAGDTRLVGEQGPEIFRPRTSGTIVPNHKLGGGGGGDTIVINQTVHVGQYVTSTEYRQGLAATERAAREGAQAAILLKRRRGDPRVKGAF